MCKSEAWCDVSQITCVSTVLSMDLVLNCSELSLPRAHPGHHAPLLTPSSSPPHRASQKLLRHFSVRQRIIHRNTVRPLKQRDEGVSDLLFVLSWQKAPPSGLWLTLIEKLTCEFSNSYEVLFLSEVVFFFVQEVFANYLIFKRGDKRNRKWKRAANYNRTVKILHWPS